MNSVLLFRTDRVGDFLLSLSLIKIIKINYPNSKITIVASEKYYKFINSFKEVDDVVVLNNSLASKISLKLLLSTLPKTIKGKSVKWFYLYMVMVFGQHCMAFWL